MPFDCDKTLRVRWGKREKDWVINSPCGPDGALIAFDLIGSQTFKELTKELDERGYDLSTLHFSIHKKEIAIR